MDPHYINNQFFWKVRPGTTSVMESRRISSWPKANKGILEP